MQGQLLHGAKVGRRFRPVNRADARRHATDRESAPRCRGFRVAKGRARSEDAIDPVVSTRSRGHGQCRDREGGPGRRQRPHPGPRSQGRLRRVEAASLKIATRFSSAEGKRMFVRMFNTLQLNMHFISVIARTRLDHEDIGRIETALRGRIDAATASLNEAIDGAEALFKPTASPAWRPTTRCRWTWTRVLSSISRRFLEVLVKLDQLMPLLQTLEIHEVVSAQAVDTQRAGPSARCATSPMVRAAFDDGLRRRNERARCARRFARRCRRS